VLSSQCCSYVDGRSSGRAEHRGDTQLLLLLLLLLLLVVVPAAKCDGRIQVSPACRKPCSCQAQLQGRKRLLEVACRSSQLS
jgi:hypothetical protein